MTAPPLDALLFVLTSLIISAAAHLYLRRHVDLGRAGTFAMACLFPLGMIALLAMNLAPRAWLAPLLVPAFAWAGVLFFTLLACGMREAWRPRTRSRWPLAVGLALGLAGFIQASRRPRVVERHVGLGAWQRPGYRIAHLSDLHVGTLLRGDFVRDLVNQTNALRPDLVALTGDLVDGSPEDLLADLAPLRDLHAPEGVWLCLGNHEHLSRAARWIPAFESLGVRVLLNARHEAQGFDLVGVDDFAAHPDFDAAFSGRDLARPAVVLAHQPRAAQAVAARGGALLLSGHTHGGQIAPLGFLEQWDQGCVIGVCQHDGLVVHVTAGAGFWGPPLRVLSRGEIALVIVDARKEARD